MVKYNSDSERGNPLTPFHGLVFPLYDLLYEMYVCMYVRMRACVCVCICVCMYPVLQRGQYMTQPLLHQLWSTGWNEKWLNDSLKDK